MRKLPNRGSINNCAGCVISRRRELEEVGCARYYAVVRELASGAMELLGREADPCKLWLGSSIGV